MSVTLMSELLTALKLVLTLQWAEYKIKPMLNIGFILSLSIATCTLLSILILNHASKQQYQQANDALESPIAYYVVPKQGRVIPVALYSHLKTLGFSQLQPVLSFT
jgi:putative ABC transport system permease protein